MNTIQVSTWVQEGYAEAYKQKIDHAELRKWIAGYVMRKGKGQLNPIQVMQLIDMETSVPNAEGWQLC